MIQLVYVVLIGWIPFCLCIFMALPPRRAAVVCTIGAWLVLPPASLDIAAGAGIPRYDKTVACVAGIILATLIFQPHRLLTFRPRWFDLPVLIWCLCPIATSLSNDLGLYDGLSAARGNVIVWGLPFLIGRLYFGDREGMRELMVGIAIAGLLCVLPCLYEVRMSPVLKYNVYGLYHYEGTRLGGFRPILFCTTGLELGMWMTAASLTAIWLWRSGSLTRIGAYPVGTIALPAIVITTLLCRSTGALFLLMMGVLALWLSTRFRSKVFMWTLILIPPFYYAVRVPDLWSGRELTGLIKTYVSEDRGKSLEYRMHMENVLAARAMEQPLWGWGGWGRNRDVADSEGVMAVPDGMWIIQLGSFGLVGLVSLTLMYITAPVLFAASYPVRSWTTPQVGPLAAAAALLSIYLCDCLMNAFTNLIYNVVAGGLVYALSSAPHPTRSIGDREWEAWRPRRDRPRAGHEGSETIAAGPDGPSGGAGPPRSLTSREKLASRYIELARGMGAQRQFHKARTAWMHASELLAEATSAAPDDPATRRLRSDCLNDFAWFLLHVPDADPEAVFLALRLATQATEAQPESGVSWNTLGAAQYRAGNFGAAIMALERSIELTGGGMGADYLLMAMAHAREGRRHEVRDWYDRAALWIEQNHPRDPELLALYKEASAILDPGDQLPLTT